MPILYDKQKTKQTSTLICKKLEETIFFLKDVRHDAVNTSHLAEYLTWSKIGVGLNTGIRYDRGDTAIHVSRTAGVLLTLAYARQSSLSLVFGISFR